MPKIILVQFWQHGTNTLVQQIYQHSYFGVVQISHPVLLLEALTSNMEVLYIVCQLPSHYSKGNILLGVFSHLKMVVLMSVL